MSTKLPLLLTCHRNSDFVSFTPELAHLAISDHDVGFWRFKIYSKKIDELDRMVLVRAKIHLPHKSLYRTYSATHTVRGQTSPWLAVTSPMAGTALVRSPYAATRGFLLQPWCVVAETLARDHRRRVRARHFCRHAHRRCHYAVRRCRHRAPATVCVVAAMARAVAVTAVVSSATATATTVAEYAAGGGSDHAADQRRWPNSGANKIKDGYKSNYRIQWEFRGH